MNWREKIKTKFPAYGFIPRTSDAGMEFLYIIGKEIDIGIETSKNGFCLSYWPNDSSPTADGVFGPPMETHALYEDLEISVTNLLKSELDEKILAECRGLIAQAWCSPKNSGKVLDYDVTEAAAQLLFKQFQRADGIAAKYANLVADAFNYHTPAGRQCCFEETLPYFRAAIVEVFEFTNQKSEL